MQLVFVEAPSMWIEDALSVISVSYRVDAQGKRVELGLGSADAYQPQPAAPGSDPSALSGSAGSGGASAAPKSRARFA